MTEEIELTPDEILRITRGTRGTVLPNVCRHHFVSTGTKREGRFLLPRPRTEYEYKCEYCGKVRWSV